MSNSEVEPRTADDLLKALKDLSHAYVRLLESARDRIVSLGGDCDSVAVMERGDPYLIRAKAAIAKAENPSAHVAAGVTGHD
jgi:hypothetical protein